MLNSPSWNLYIYKYIFVYDANNFLFMNVLWWPGNSSIKVGDKLCFHVYFYKYINTNYKMDQRFECSSVIFKIQTNIKI